MAPITIAQLSDIHLTDGEPGPMFDHRARLEQAIESINRSPLEPDAVLITGDLTLDGHPDEYPPLREAFDRLQIPLLIIGGNHDDRAPLKEFFPQQPWADAAHRSWTARVGSVALIGLDSTQPNASTGAIDDERADWLDGALSEANGTAASTVLAMHHPPMSVRVGTFDNHGFTTPELLAAVLNRHRVDRIWCGHFHRSMVSEFAGVVCQVAPTTIYQFGIDQRGFVDHGVQWLVHRYYPDEQRWMSYTEQC